MYDGFLPGTTDDAVSDTSSCWILLSLGQEFLTTMNWRPTVIPSQSV